MAWPLTTASVGRASTIHRKLSASFPHASHLTCAAIFFVALIPFFAFQESARVLGGGALWNLFFRRGEKRFRLIED
jgi:hypothetical protein